MLTKAAYITTNLTETQKGIYFDCQFEDPIAYHISSCFLLEDVDVKQFESAFKLLIAEQEALRSCVKIVDDMPALVTYDAIDFAITPEDITDQAAQDEYIKSIIEQGIKHEFNLTEAPLFRCKLLKLDSQRFHFFICIHHIISDGLSLNLLIKKLMDFYQKLHNQKPVVVKNDGNYLKFIKQEQENLHLNKYDKEKQFWKQKMRGIEPMTLQGDYSPEKKSGLGKEMRFPISNELVKAIQHASMDNEVTIFTYFLASFSLLISYYAQQSEVILNSPFSHRNDEDYENTIGCFIRMLPLRFNIDKDASFATLLQQVSNEFIGAYKNINYPNNLIIRDTLSSDSITSATSIFDVTFVYDVYDDELAEDQTITLLDQDIVTFPGSMMVVLCKIEDEYSIRFQYKPTIFTDRTIELLGARYLNLLTNLVSDSHIQLNNIDYLLKDEKKQLLDDFNQSSYFDNKPTTLIQLFTESARNNHDQIALIEDNQTRTYGWVNAQAELIAKRILQVKTKPNECIGVQFDRSIDLIVAILAVLKAGCAYVAIEPNHPVARKEFIFDDAQISILLTKSSFTTEYQHKLHYLNVDEVNDNDNNSDIILEHQNPHDLAYIAYTSGSTGNPKGVMIENQSVVNTLLDLERRFPVSKQDVFLFKTPYSFIGALLTANLV